MPCLPQILRRFPCRRFISRRHYCQTQSITPIERLIHGSIKATGPISYATYMQLCLSHPEHGYYMSSKNPVFGARGDFITSPEISQVFGELIGIWLVQQWMAAGCSSAIRLVELGPGRGTLLDDILRTITALSKNKLVQREVFLLENSPTMREVQKGKLAHWIEKGWNFTWLDSLEHIPQAEESPYTMVVAHEFFDALPIYVFKKAEDGWHELRVTEQPQVEGTTEFHPLSPSLDKAISLTAQFLTKVSPRLSSTPEGDVIEVSRDAWLNTEQIGKLLLSGKQKAGGCALVIDYGENRASGDSIRAFKNHKQVSPFYRPGECDLTANVDFAYLKESLEALRTSLPESEAGRLQTLGPISQAEFLGRMGLEVRATNLLKAATETDTSNPLVSRIIDATNRLVDTREGGMGSQYKFLGVIAASPHTILDGSEVIWPFTTPEPQHDPDVQTQ